MAEKVNNEEQEQVMLREIALTNPQRLFKYPVTQYNPSALVSRQGLRIFDRMRNDDQIKAAMMLKKEAVLATPYTLEPPEGEQEDAQMQETIDFIKWNFDNMQSTLYAALLDCLTALDYGYSISEKIYTIAETPWGDRITLDALKIKAPHFFQFVADEYGELKELKQSRSYLGTPDPRISLPVNKFVIMTVQKEWGNWYGKSDLEAAYRPWVVKDNAYKWFAMFLERRGIPPIFLLYDSRMSPQTVEVLKDVVKNMQANTAGIIPTMQNAKGDSTTDFWSPDAQSTRSGREVFTAAFKQFNTDIARALLMPGLLGITPDEKEGSYARSKVQFDVFLMTTTFLRAFLADEIIQEQIIKPIVDLNYPGYGKYPVFGWEPLTEEIRNDLLNTWAALVKAGAMITTPEDAAHIREELKFPESEESPEEEPEEEPDEEPEEPEETMTGIQMDITGRQRSIIFFAQDGKRLGKASINGINIGLDTLEGIARTRIVSILEGTRDALKSFVKRNWEQMPKVAKDLKLRGMNDLEEALREFMRQGFSMGRADLRKEVGAKMVAGMFTPQEALKYLAAKAFNIKGVLKDKLVGEAQAVLLNALATGELPDVTVQKLHDIFEPYVGAPGIIEDGKVIEPHRLETILRTNATDAYNQGRLAEARELDDLVQGMLYSAILDQRTSVICSTLDGKVFRMDDPELSRFAPPNHFNCRSVLVAIPIGVEVERKTLVSGADKGKAADEMDPSFGGNAT